MIRLNRNITDLCVAKKDTKFSINEIIENLNDKEKQKLLMFFLRRYLNDVEIFGSGFLEKIDRDIFQINPNEQKKTWNDAVYDIIKQNVGEKNCISYNEIKKQLVLIVKETGSSAKKPEHILRKTINELITKGLLSKQGIGKYSLT